MSGSVFNISMRRPHAPARYGAMWREAFAKRRPVNFWADYSALIGGVSALEGDENLLIGDLYRFLDLEQIRRWFNTQTNEVAANEDLEKISIPDHLKPHFSYVPYLFDTNIHRLFVVTLDGQDSFSPSSIERFLSALFSSDSITDKYGPIAIQAEPDRGELARIFSMKNISTLTIELVNPPNPGDDLSDAERAALERIEMEMIEEQNLSGITRIYRGLSEGGVKPTPNTRALAEIAQSNGHVTATGHILGTKKAVTLSTKTRALETSLVYNPDKELRQSAFLALASKLKRAIDDRLADS